MKPDGNFLIADTKVPNPLIATLTLADMHANSNKHTDTHTHTH